MTVYERARPGDEEEILDLANYVFSQSSRPHDFAKLLPKVYAQGRSFADIHYVARDHGSIRAQVAVLPMELFVGAHCLKIGYVGTVSVHPRARGEGHMKGCMTAALADADRLGLDMLALGGQRQRYQYFGFESGGQRLEFTLNHANARHALADVDTDGIVFSPLSQSDVPRALALYDTQRIHCAREADTFLTVLRSWYYEPLAIRKGDCLIGYVCASGDSISEMPLADEGDLYAVLKAWLAFRGAQGAHITVYPHQPVRALMLDAVCEDVRLSGDCMYNIRNWQPVLTALLSLKHAIAPMTPGHAVLDIRDVCRLAVDVRQSGVSVDATDEAPDVSLSALAAQRLLLSPVSAVTPAPAAFRDWLPLYCSIPVADQF